MAPDRRQRKPVRTTPFAPGPSVLLNKSKGQHLLKNSGVLDNIIKAAQIKASDTVLEIGPGTGNLTMRLLPLCKRVVAFDVDSRMIAEVKKRAMVQGHQNLTATEGNALHTDLGMFNVCTANLPYKISSPFTFRLLAHPSRFRCAVLMFQREFAERLMAKAGDKHYCRLSVNVQLFCNVTRVCKVSPGSFNPPPKVESMVVKLVPRERPLDVEFREWDGLLRIVFERRHRTLRAAFNKTNVLQALQTNYRYITTRTGQIEEEGEEVDPTSDFKTRVLGVLEEAGMSQQRGAQTGIDAFFALLLRFHDKGIHFTNNGRAFEDLAKFGADDEDMDLES